MDYLCIMRRQLCNYCNYLACNNMQFMDSEQNVVVNIYCSDIFALDIAGN